MSEISEKLFSGIEEQGWKGRTVSIDHLPEIKRAVRGRYEEGLLDRTLFREQLSDFEFEPPANLPAARSILIVAAPVPQTRVYFNWKGTRFPLVIPPTYAGYLKTTASIVAALDSWLVPGGFRAVVARLPLKTVAVGSGLADYGRNNLCYVAGMGSMLQLVGAFSDLPCDTDFWQ
jgi:epoxyqueuosine reductase